MNPVVTARVPEGVRNRGLEVLAEIGATTSDLVNAAFAYVIEERQLPAPQRKDDGTALPGARTLNQEQEAELRSFLSEVSVGENTDWGSEPFEQLLAHAMEDRYAALR